MAAQNKNAGVLDDPGRDDQAGEIRAGLRPYRTLDLLLGGQVLHLHPRGRGGPKDGYIKSIDDPIDALHPRPEGQRLRGREHPPGADHDLGPCEWNEGLYRPEVGRGAVLHRQARPRRRSLRSAT